MEVQIDGVWFDLDESWMEACAAIMDPKIWQAAGEFGVAPVTPAGWTMYLAMAGF